MNATQNLADLSLSALVALYNEHSDKPVKKFKDKPTAIARVTAILPKVEVKAKAKNHPAVKSVTWTPETKAEKTEKTEKTEKPAFVDSVAVKYLSTQKIKDIAPNPKREGTASYARYEMYKQGMTVAQFLEAGGKRADIAWDAERGYITVA